MRGITSIVLGIAFVIALTGSAHAEKKREVATYLSAGGAIASSTLVVASFFTAPADSDVNAPLFYTGIGTSVLTPSLGEWYVGRWLTWGMAIRAAAAGFAITAIATQQENVSCDVPAPGKTCTELSGPGLALAGAAAIAYIGGVAYDVITANDIVDSYNSTHYMVTPTVMATPRGAAPGLYFSATY